MTFDITGWYLEGVDFDEAPESMTDLSRQATRVDLTSHRLLAAAMWEPLFRPVEEKPSEGWTTLGALAETRRGIATGHNSFFLLSRDSISDAALPLDSSLPCVGRATDVHHFIFREEDFARLDCSGARVWLLNMSEPLSEAERAYVSSGESKGVHHRYLTKTRRPWFSMERRAPAPIWASVFGRGDLKFVLNQTKCRSLTNFHGVYPRNLTSIQVKGLVACLNSAIVRKLSASTTRTYGGGLKKFEPRDLTFIPVPDVTKAKPSTLAKLSARLSALDTVGRFNEQIGDPELDDLVFLAGSEAALHLSREHLL